MLARRRVGCQWPGRLLPHGWLIWCRDHRVSHSCSFFSPRHGGVRAWQATLPRCTTSALPGYQSVPDFILRVNRDRLYKTIHLKAVEDDPRLSWKAVGLHTYLTSRPDGWEFNRSDLANRHTDGVGSVKKGLLELRDAGYLRTSQPTNPNTGQFDRYDWFISEVPLSTDQEWLAFMESPVVENEPPDRRSIIRQRQTDPYSKSKKGEQTKEKELTLETEPSNGALPKGWKPKEWEVFTYWREQRVTVIGLNGGPQMKPTAKRQGKIRARLAEGYTVPQLKEAVDGLLISEYNVSRGHTDIELICRDQQHVEQYRTRLENHGKSDEEADAVEWAKAERDRIIGGGE